MLMIFAVLHMDGHAVYRLPYRERRSLLGDLGLDGACWRTPRHFEGDHAALLEATREQQLEGVVAKRLDSPYQPGQRSGAWIKTKHRRREILTVTAWRPGGHGRPDSFILGRENADGTLRYAGEACYGLARNERDRLRRLLVKHDAGRARWSRACRGVAPVIRVVVDSHGPPPGALRDPVLREVLA